MSDKIVDLITMHQILLEANKSFTYKFIEPVIDDIKDEFSYYLSAIHDNFSELSDSEIKVMVDKLQAYIEMTLEKYYVFMLTKYEQFEDIETRMILTLLMMMNGETPKDVVSREDGFNWVHSKVDKRNNIVLPSFSFIFSSLMGNGEYMKNSMKTLNNIISKKLTDSLTYAYANKLSISEYKDSLFGTSLNRYKDGLLSRIKYMNSSSVNTIMQHISSKSDDMINTALSSEHLKKPILNKPGNYILKTKRYMWVSIIDHRTSLICRQRNRNIYVYGKGPIPPAHYYCRSKVIRYLGKESETTYKSWYDWIKRQPTDVQNYVLGEDLANKLNAGLLNADDLPSFRNKNKLSHTKYLESYNKILKPGFIR